ncbi:MAG: zinc-ribbon domain-containing protein [Candidatus Binatota bacterium]|nr:zinc-ribbon domain-containing protein [Candidatus Binatota bacterium]
MLVQCPSCRTTYRVADEVVKGAAPAFRCSRCKHNFELEGAETALVTPEKPAPSEAAVAREPQDRELTFSFSPPPAAKTDKFPQTAVGSANPPAETPGSPAPDRWLLKPEPSNTLTEPPFTKLADTATREQEKIVDIPNNFDENEPAFAAPQLKQEQDNPANILAMSSYVDQRASIRPYLSLFGLLLVGFSLLAAMTYAKPAAMENLVEKIPFVGATVLKNNHLKDGVLLQSLRTGYQNINGDREVLVLTGVAFNQNPVVIREVKVTGKVFNLEGKELEKQTIWIGNTISPKIIRGMTAEDIPHLQDLKPLKSFELPPGDSIAFTMVFLKPAKQVKDFSLEVVLADGEI